MEDMDQYLCPIYFLFTKIVTFEAGNITSNIKPRYSSRDELLWLNRPRSYVGHPPSSGRPWCTTAKWQNLPLPDRGKEKKKEHKRRRTKRMPGEARARDANAMPCLPMPLLDKTSTLIVQQAAPSIPSKAFHPSTCFLFRRGSHVYRCRDFPYPAILGPNAKRQKIMLSSESFTGQKPCRRLRR
jgi:hypothetical protein